MIASLYQSGSASEVASGMGRGLGGWLPLEAEDGGGHDGRIEADAVRGTSPTMLRARQQVGRDEAFIADDADLAQGQMKLGFVRREGIEIDGDEDDVGAVLGHLA